MKQQQIKYIQSQNMEPRLHEKRKQDKLLKKKKKSIFSQLLQKGQYKQMKQLKRSHLKNKEKRNYKFYFYFNISAINGKKLIEMIF